MEVAVSSRFAAVYHPWTGIGEVTLSLGRVLTAGLALMAASCASNEPAQARPSRPNFVVVLADDLGWGDLGCYGEPVVRTPNLDRFASEGVRFTSCYAGAANCSPARAALLTGRIPFRVGIHNWIPIGSPVHLRRDEVTLATLLRQEGYATSQVGKWHLNGGLERADQPQPSDHGFDQWFATQNNALPNHQDPDNFVRNGGPVGKLEGYSAGIVAHEAIRWLTGRRDLAKPFFLFVCFHEPHEPIATEPRYAELYPGEPARAAHHGNITQMDAAFGRLMEKLDALGLRDSTFVFFTSDNGPAITNVHPHGSTGGLREKKGHLYEGGIRVPGILRWPGRVRPGQVSDEPVCGVDLLPTVCALTGIRLPTDRPIDGASLLPVFEGKPIARKTPLYWQFTRAASRPKVAMRQGDWKILASLTGPPLPIQSDIPEDEARIIKEAELESFELYHLREDPGEASDRAQAEPGRLEAMSAALRRLYREVRDESPTWPAWKDPRVEAQRIVWPPYWKPREKKP